MVSRTVATAFFFVFLLMNVNAYSQTKPDSTKINWKSPHENYDIKYTYHGKGIYYIHAEPVTRKDYAFYLRKCDSISIMNGHPNITLSAVPEVELISEASYYRTGLGFVGGGINIRLPFNFFYKDSAPAYLKNFSLNWKELFGITSTNYFYFHTNGESTLISKIPLGNGQSSSGNSIGIGILTIVALVLPEGISYTTPLKNHWRINTFINPLGGDYWKDAKINYKTGASTLDFGIRPSFVTYTKMTLGFTLGYRINYADSYNRGLEGGISLGWQLY